MIPICAVAAPHLVFFCQFMFSYTLMFSHCPLSFSRVYSSWIPNSLFLPSSNSHPLPIIFPIQFTAVIRTVVSLSLPIPFLLDFPSPSVPQSRSHAFPFSSPSLSLLRLTPYPFPSPSLTPLDSYHSLPSCQDTTDLAKRTASYRSPPILPSSLTLTLPTPNPLLTALYPPSHPKYLVFPHP